MKERIKPEKNNHLLQFAHVRYEPEKTSERENDEVLESENSKVVETKTVGDVLEGDLRWGRWSQTEANLRFVWHKSRLLEINKEVSQLMWTSFYHNLIPECEEEYAKNKCNGYISLSTNAETMNINENWGPMQNLQNKHVNVECLSSSWEEGFQLQDLCSHVLWFPAWARYVCKEMQTGCKSEPCELNLRTVTNSSIIIQFPSVRRAMIWACWVAWVCFVDHIRCIWKQRLEQAPDPRGGSDVARSRALRSLYRAHPHARFKRDCMAHEYCCRITPHDEIFAPCTLMKWHSSPPAELPSDAPNPYMIVIRLHFYIQRSFELMNQCEHKARSIVSSWM